MLFLGLDLSTQQLKGIVVDSNLNQVEIANVEFEVDFPDYNTRKGVYTNGDEVQAPVKMWLEAIDLLLLRLIEKGTFSISDIKGISGACQQHGSVFWNNDATNTLKNMTAKYSLKEQLEKCFAWDMSPNWQDHSTQEECDAFEKSVGGPDQLAAITGSKAHHRFTGPQILRVKRVHPQIFSNVERVSLVSSFLASIFSGKIVNIDESDACGMNLWDIEKKELNASILTLFDDPDKIASLIGDINQDGKSPVASISPYFVSKYGFCSDCSIVPFTGDNPGTILSLPLKPNDVIVSLGTSTTALVVTNNYVPSPLYHLFVHPTNPHAFMGMLCYCNGSLAREKIRDEINGKDHSKDWTKFNLALDRYIQENKTLINSSHMVGFYFPLSEIIPNVHACQIRLQWDSIMGNEIVSTKFNEVEEDVNGILESQALSIRHRLAPMLTEKSPRRVYFVGGASQNQSICKAFSRVLVPSEGSFVVQDMKDACALGAAAKAIFGVLNNPSEHWEAFIEKRMPDNKFLNVDNPQADLFGEDAVNLFVKSETYSFGI